MNWLEWIGIVSAWVVITFVVAWIVGVAFMHTGNGLGEGAAIRAGILAVGSFILICIGSILAFAFFLGSVTT